jgi:Aspartyl protease
MDIDSSDEASQLMYNDSEQHELFVTDLAYSSLDQCIDDARSNSSDMFSIARLVRGQPPRKKTKTENLKPIVFVRFNPRLGKAKPITLKCLMDTGASGSLVAKKYATKLRLKKTTGDNQAVWTTPAGNLKTTHQCQCAFVLPEFF